MDTYINNKNLKLRILSYNSRGFDSIKQKFCQNLLRENGTDDQKISILCNQENFVLRGNKFKINQALPNHHIIFKSAVKNNLDGRPRNGMFIAIPDDIKGNVNDVSPQHWRIQAIILKSINRRLLLINTYFPQDTRSLDHKDIELEEVLAEINSVFEKNNFNDVIWTGDINVDFSRENGHSRRVSEYINEMNLVKAWENFAIDFTHEHTSNNNTHVSTIDHIFWNTSTEIKDAGVLHCIENTSDHHPIFCMLNYTISTEVNKSVHAVKAKPSWTSSTDEQKENFRKELNEKLTNLEIDSNIRQCRNVHCTDEGHLGGIDDFLATLLKDIESSANNNLHVVDRKTETEKKSAIPCWKEEVQPFKEDALFWHAIWLSAGKPLNTQLHMIMRRTRNIYHYQIRKCKNMVNILKKNTLLNACLQNNGDIFSELRRLRYTKDANPNTIDGIQDNVQNHFADIYSKLYNSFDDQEKVKCLYNQINQKITSCTLHEVLKVTPSVVEEAVGHLKRDKKDPISDIISDYIRNSPKVLYDKLSSLFRYYLIHGHVSKMLTLSTLIPLIKDKLGDHCSSKNYRSIALSSLILKIFDWVIIILCKDKLVFDDLQFSYQSNCSTNMCTWMVVETIDYFCRNGSDVFTSVMDMTKAFDNVSHSKLFKKVIDRGIPLIYIRFLMTMYENQQLMVKWNSAESWEFGMKNGVKQGAVLSALLFCIYIDELFESLRSKKTGCWIDGLYLGILGYADDVFLLSPSLDGLQEMIKTCEEFAKENNLTFSTDPNPNKCKTKCLAFLKKPRTLKNLLLGDIKLPWVDSAKHLGNKITNAKKGILAQDVLEKRAAYISRNNELCQELHYAHPKTLVKVNNTFNSSFYGSTLWDLNSSEVERIYKTWNVSQRIMHGLDRKTHKYLIEPVSESRHIMHAMHKRFIKFFKNIDTSKKIALRGLFTKMKYDCQSRTGRNLRHLMLRYDVDLMENIQCEILNQKYVDIPPKELWRIHVIKEVIDVKHGLKVIPGFNNKELQELLVLSSIN